MRRACSTFRRISLRPVCPYPLQSPSVNDTSAAREEHSTAATSISPRLCYAPSQSCSMWCAVFVWRCVPRTRCGSKERQDEVQSMLRHARAYANPVSLCDKVKPSSLSTRKKGGLRRRTCFPLAHIEVLLQRSFVTLDLSIYLVPYSLRFNVRLGWATFTLGTALLFGLPLCSSIIGELLVHFELHGVLQH